MASIALPRSETRPASGIMSWLTTVDHKKIGILYLYTTFAFFLVGGIFALLMRTQLAVGNNHFLAPQTYNEIMTLHGTTMIFLWIIPVFSGFGNYFVPLMIGARDMAFPRINAFSFWMIPLGGLVMYGALLASPFLTGLLAMVLLDRQLGTDFFIHGSDPLLYQFIFWFYSHPAVYIMILPAFGIVSEIIPVFSRKPIFGYRAMAFSMAAIGVLGFMVFAHH